MEDILLMACANTLFDRTFLYVGSNNAEVCYRECN